MARCDTPSAIARCFSCLRNVLKLAPLWQAASRAGANPVGWGAASVAGFDATIGLAERGSNCSAEAAQESVNTPARVTAKIRKGEKAGGIVLSPARVDSFAVPPNIPNPGKRKSRRCALRDLQELCDAMRVSCHKSLIDEASNHGSGRWNAGLSLR